MPFTQKSGIQFSGDLDEKEKSLDWVNAYRTVRKKATCGIFNVKGNSNANYCAQEF